MFSRRIAMALMSAIWILAAAAGPVAAAKPTRGVAGEQPLTAEEQAASARKVAAAEHYLATSEARALGRVGLACVTPEGVVPTRAAEANAGGCGGVPSDFLAVAPRDQIRGTYCGPAVGQVIANYTWAMAANANKYTQTQIAGWMQTDRYGGTSAHTLEDGLELGTAGAPRRPAGWDWVVTNLTDSDRDGTFGDQLHVTCAPTSAAAEWRSPSRSCRTRMVAAST